MSSSSSTSSSSSHPPPVTQKVFGPGVSKARKGTMTPTAPKKRSVPNSQVTKKKILKIDGLTGLSMENIYWVTPMPGYGNPLNLNSIPENTGKVFIKWFNWESSDRIGYTLIDSHEVKYWADAASIHMLSQAKLAGIEHDFFSFLVFREGKSYKYGFIPREFAPDEKLQSFLHFRDESQGTIEVKDEEEEQPKVKHNNNNTTAAVTKEEEGEDLVKDIDLINID